MSSLTASTTASPSALSVSQNAFSPIERLLAHVNSNPDPDQQPRRIMMSGSRMLTAISRYGVRGPPEPDAIVERCKRAGQLVQGPAIDQFERAFEARIGQGSAIAASYGRMAFYHMLKALELPAGSEMVVPAL